MPRWDPHLPRAGIPALDPGRHCLALPAQDGLGSAVSDPSLQPLENSIKGKLIVGPCISLAVLPISAWSTSVHEHVHLAHS